nr:Led-NPF-2=neuropeptide F-related peptide [Leptinotarsa decemlineata=Colorado potato beetles, cerebral ganglia, Peptide, 7 aa] [Leptinotarsa decemlineata]
APSLRLR